MAFGNMFGSNPDYDEAYGPGTPHGNFLGEDEYVPVDQLPEGIGEGCLSVRQHEDYEDMIDRAATADPDDPLGPNETPEEARMAAEIDKTGGFMVNRVDPDYDYSKLAKPELAALFFEDDEFTAAKAGVVTVLRKKTVYRNGK